MQIQLNGHTTTVETGSTVLDLLARLDLTGKRVAVEINRQIVPRSQHANHTVQENDVVEVVVAVGGG
ncbi:sulfur carrier protein ThiS [Orrella marina]|uniref:Thiamine biosynthesis protein ThiS n=1 Tax=Orrella marina TaxID=2163011 RepID=A0A2R4XKQ0_9BURK|nr:sulfur carrier protein ThiS [Orrella marina]AWB34375.1 thiamine biosynthesis protein ThiS [Orrella marina]